MADFRDLARDPHDRRRFEKLLYLAAQRGDADLAAERLTWGIDPDCISARAARRVFNDPAEVEKIVEILEAGGGNGSTE